VWEFDDHEKRGSGRALVTEDAICISAVVTIFFYLRPNEAWNLSHDWVGRDWGVCPVCFSLRFGARYCQWAEYPANLRVNVRLNRCLMSKPLPSVR
jgi:hypothetical protein